MAVKKISPIKKQYPREFRSLESSLAEKGFARNPGAFKILLPYKGINGTYYTGLDENAAYIKRLPEEEAKAEVERIREDKARLEAATGLDLSPKSQFYNYAANLPDDRKVSPIKLGNQDKFFNMEDPMEEIAFNWARVRPDIAPSMQAIQRGEVNPSVVQYYVADDELENRITFTKKQKLNKAIGQLDSLTPDKLRQVARLMGLPVTESTKTEVAYNLVDNALKEGDFKTGEHKGRNTVTLFTELLELSESRIHVKDLVNEAIKSSIYRIKGNDRIYEGETEIASSKEALVNHLVQDKNQEELFALEKKLNINKITALT